MNFLLRYSLLVIDIIYPLTIKNAVFEFNSMVEIFSYGVLMHCLSIRFFFFCLLFLYSSICSTTALGSELGYLNKKYLTNNSFFYVYLKQHLYAIHHRFLLKDTTPNTLKKVSCKIHINAPYKFSRLIKKEIQQVYDDTYKLSLTSNQDLDFFLEKIVKNIQDILQREGYFFSKISINTDPGISFQKKGSAVLVNKNKIIIIDIKPGKQIKIKKVTMRFHGDINLEAMERIPVIKAAFSLRPGDYFSQRAWHDAKMSVLHELQSERYLGAYINFSEAIFNKKVGGIDLIIDLFSGPTFYWGPITISGTHRYPEFIVNRIHSLQENSIYSRSQLTELYNKIYSTKYYAGVNIGITNITPYNKYVGVNVKLKELPIYGLRSGIGYSVDRGYYLYGDFRCNNTFGKSWILTANTRYDQKNPLSSIAILAPPDQKGYIHSLSLAANRSIFDYEPLTSLKITLSKEGSSYFYDHIYALSLYKDFYSNGLDKGDSNPYVLSPNIILKYKNLNRLIYPYYGSLSYIDCSVGIKGLISNSNFFRLYYRGNYYLPLSQKNILMMHGETGLIFSSTQAINLPKAIRFRSGGASSVRGYEVEEIAKMFNGYPIAAKYLFTMGMEYQYWFLKNFGFASFFDAGFISNSLYSLSYPCVGYGFGIRWKSRVGPVNMDIAWKPYSSSSRLHVKLDFTS